MADIPLKVHLESNSCICPCQSYTCQKNNVIILKWQAVSFSGDDAIEYSLLDSKDLDRTDREINRGCGPSEIHTVNDRGGVTNISSTLSIVDLTLNVTNLTCDTVAEV